MLIYKRMPIWVQWVQVLFKYFGSSENSFGNYQNQRKIVIHFLLCKHFLICHFSICVLQWCHPYNNEYNNGERERQILHLVKCISCWIHLKSSFSNWEKILFRLAFLDFIRVFKNLKFVGKMLHKYAHPMDKKEKFF